MSIAETSQYNRTYNSLNPNWSNRPQYNRMFLRSVEQHYNTILRLESVPLNDVYLSLGFDRTEEGALVGWSKGTYIELDIVPEESGHDLTIIFNVNTNNVFHDE